MKTIYFLVIGGILFLSTAGANNAATQCDHQYTCIGKVYNKYGAIWIEDSATGECGEYDVLSLITWRDNDSALYLSGFASPKLTDPLRTGISWEPMEELHDSNGVFYSDSGFMISPPQGDPLFDSVSRQLAIDSILDMAPDIIRIASRFPKDLPTINFWKPELIWSHPGGLYKGYALRKVYWFPKSKILVVCTDQPRTGSGLDTMHGILVLQAGISETEKR